MRTYARFGEMSAASGERLCYYCNEGRCASCSGWDRTIAAGQMVEVPCAHDCRRQEHRKPNQRAIPEVAPKRRNHA